MRGGGGSVVKEAWEYFIREQMFEQKRAKVISRVNN
jgi:hypothetical protein